MIPRKRGHRDAAWGVEINPYDFKLMPASHDAWVDAKAYVDHYRSQGLDPAGHAPKIPHLCERDVTKVCNCCHPCGVECWTEQFEGAAERVHKRATGVLVSVRSLLKKVLRL